MGGRVLEEVRETLGPLGGLVRRSRRHRSLDQRQLALQTGPQPAGAQADERLEPADREVEPGEILGGLAPGPVLLKRYDSPSDMFHNAMMNLPSDTVLTTSGSVH